MKNEKYPKILISYEHCLGPVSMAGAAAYKMATSSRTRVVLLAQATSGAAGSGGTTRAHTIDQRLAIFLELAPEGVEVDLVELDLEAWEADPHGCAAVTLERLRGASAIVALFAYGPAPHRRWCFFGEVLMPMVPQLVPDLKLVQVLSSGVDEYLGAADVVTLAEVHGITVANNGGANAVAVSEAVMGLVYALFRSLVPDVLAVKEGRWNRGRKGKREEKAYLAQLGESHSWAGGVGGQEISGKTVGIVGFGNIGRQVARRFSGYDCELLYYDTEEQVIGRRNELGATFTPFEELLQRSDIVTLHVPHTATTKGMMGPREFELMKKSAVLINTCRGPVVQEAALVAALETAEIAAAGVDVTEVEPVDASSPLLTLPNVVVTPHNAGGTSAASFKAMEFSMANVARCSITYRTYATVLLSRVLVFGLVLLLIQIARESATTVECFAVCKRCAANAWFKALAAQKECTREACGARRTLATASTTQTRIFIYHCGNRVCIPCISARCGTRSMRQLDHAFLSAATTLQPAVSSCCAVMPRCPLEDAMPRRRSPNPSLPHPR